MHTPRLFKQMRSLSVASLKKGHINSFLGNFDEARTDYDKGIAGAEDVNKINYANFRAFTYVHAGQPAVAIQELEKLRNSANSMKLPKEQIRCNCAWHTHE